MGAVLFLFRRDKAGCCGGEPEAADDSQSERPSSEQHRTRSLLLSLFV
jgi:hypothetical protein